MANPSVLAAFLLISNIGAVAVSGDATTNKAKRLRNHSQLSFFPEYRKCTCGTVVGLNRQS